MNNIFKKLKKDIRLHYVDEITKQIFYQIQILKNNLDNDNLGIRKNYQLFETIYDLIDTEYFLIADNFKYEYQHELENFYTLYHRGVSEIIQRDKNQNINKLIRLKIIYSCYYQEYKEEIENEIKEILEFIYKKNF